MLFAASTFSYGDRMVLSIAATDISRDLHLNALRLGDLFSAFSWAYAAQLPSSTALAPGACNGISIACWSCSAFLSGFAGCSPAAVAFCILLPLLLLSGRAQSPGFPGNGRIVAAWFPAAERGCASAIFNTSQYFSLVIFAPLMGWIAHIRLEAGASVLVGWRACTPRTRGHQYAHLASPAVAIKQSHADRDRPRTVLHHDADLVLPHLVPDLSQSIYLSQSRRPSIVTVGFLAAVPALLVSQGGILGGVASDRLLKAGHSLTFATQGADRGRHAPCHDHDCLQLRKQRPGCDVPDVAGLLRQGVRRAGMDRYLRDISQELCR